MIKKTITKQQILEELRALKSHLLEDYKVLEISLFGSFARGDQHKDSDIDVLVDFKKDADLFDLIGLSLYLEEVFGRSVDVVPQNALREEFRETVLEQVVAV